MTEKQRTIKKAVSVKGTGLHTGNEVTLTFNPAPEHHGIKFRRVDIEGQPLIEADVDYVVDTSRGTSLSKNGADIHTCEHVLAAVSGLKIDNLLIDLDRSEPPIMDGSSKYFVEALAEAGYREQEAVREYIEIHENIVYTDPKNKIEIIAIPSDTFKVSVMINFETRVLGTQFAVMNDISEFKEEISNSRTFVFLHELEYLLSNNLIKGGDLSNAIVFVNRVVSQEELDRLADLFKKPRVNVMQDGILNNLELHHLNEPARHKLLDVVGDLTLLGKPLKAHIIARRPGHAANVQLGKLIKQYSNTKKMTESFSVDLSKEPLFDINDIQRFLPHRPPFLFIDKIMEMDKEHIVGVKNVTMNETFFEGHFPGNPVMPGVIQVEAMAQTGGVLLLANVDNPEDYITLFLKIEDVKFRKVVKPGDTLVFHNKLIKPIRRGIGVMHGKAYVNGKVVMEGTMMASLIRKDEINE
ncbi:MAG TPA: bifunctional UDP-3-O-[3-hydroxymyristoyl] N-acetylglucosamine deacetylase/3-hydroxyacyl-ACP dehydratase [Bacteroidales bacterium]|nr:bifunctional UDP-3-O-[3-hydroxymyristoyl] N-acetylglucosamine deacetylase/3-hydroxyacyl-ACP dehydratase [Bacteroidales bacterium]